jgi:hypothetical protein
MLINNDLIGDKFLGHPPGLIIRELLWRRLHKIG